jgi:nuclear pore complex protein Nup98-Nup96
LAASQLKEAQNVILLHVGPRAIIERDYEQLANVLSQFPRGKPTGWEKGGQVYEDFVSLCRMNGMQRQSDEGTRLVKSLRRGLSALEEDIRMKTLEQRVAGTEMRRKLETVVKERGDEVKGRANVGVDAGGLAMLERYRAAMGVVV